MGAIDKIFRTFGPGALVFATALVGPDSGVRADDAKSRTDVATPDASCDERDESNKSDESDVVFMPTGDRAFLDWGPAAKTLRNRARKEREETSAQLPPPRATAVKIDDAASKPKPLRIMRGADLSSDARLVWVPRLQSNIAEIMSHGELDADYPNGKPGADIPAFKERKRQEPPFARPAPKR